MARGFKDSRGKFHPTGNNGRRSSREKSIDIRSVDPETGVIEGMTLAEQRKAEIEMSGVVRDAILDKSKIGSESIKKVKTVTEKMNDSLVLDEREINFIKNTMNKYPDSSKRPEVVQDMLDATWSNEDGHEITMGQNEKGGEWLNRKPQRDRMGTRETGVMDDFKEIRLLGITETHSGSEFYIPFWRVIANDGSTFEYRNIGGELSIDG